MLQESTILVSLTSFFFFNLFKIQNQEKKYALASNQQINLVCQPVAGCWNSDYSH